MRHRPWLLKGTRTGTGLTLVILAGGCIQVRAPDKPIEINLNVKIQQEVVVRLQQDAKDLIQNNPELFPQ
ncbi:YnbE family lipoprotein [Sphingobium nicotianae]|uniref:YnbE family lipoprotein n=1 Tax=Sphingobium nicotianae TaxID=2782607 RepID=A0A9X1D9I5_9SPHN|nr:YnbE family lipoprotein [Sphingobium nicotianae]MBT2185841.1 YnbE family lipoprotein [Sphingobium nicotianae]